MPNHQTIQLVGPLGGLNRAGSYQNQPPYTTPDCADVVSIDTAEKRVRISRRPCLARQFNAVSGSGATGVTTGILGGGQPIRLASVIRTLNNTGQTTFSDAFNDSSLSANWTVGTFTVNGTTPHANLPLVSGGTVKVDVTTAVEARIALLVGITNISTTGYREVRINHHSTNAAAAGEEYSLYLDLNSASPSESSGIVARFQPQSSSGFFSYEIFVNGVLALRQSRSSNPPNRLDFFKLSIDSANRVAVRWNDADGEAAIIATDYIPPAVPLAGFALKKIAVGFPCEADSFSMYYVSSGGAAPPESWAGSSNGHFYVQRQSGAVEKVTGGTDTSVPTAGTNISLASTIALQAAARLAGLYIADYQIRRERLVIHGNADIVQDGGLDKLTDVDINFVTAGVDPITDVLELIATSGGAPSTPVGVYAITAVTATHVTFTAGGVTTATSVAYRILRGPKFYDSTINTLALMPLGTVGVSQPPVGCKSVVVWQDRLVWSQDSLYPQRVLVSAVGNPNDYDYGDSGFIGDAAAFDLSAQEHAGAIGEPVVTCIPASDDALIIACTTSFYFMLGNPRVTFSAPRNISREYGLVGMNAWCRGSASTEDEQEVIYVMTQWGLCFVVPQPGGLKSISDAVVPAELHGLSSDRYDVSLSYDGERKRINIDASGRDAATSSIHYFYDLRANAFWPRFHDPTLDAMCATKYESVGTAVLFGCRDGAVRRFDDAAVNDDGFAFTPRYKIGPIRGGRTDREYGAIHDLSGTLDEQSGSAIVKVYAGETSQAALSSKAVVAVALSNGTNYVHPIAASGACFFVEVVGAPCEPFIVEDITISREMLGEYRKV